MESNDENLLKPDNAPDINQKKKKRLILFGSIIGALVIAIAIVIIVVVVKNKKNEEDSIEGSMLEITYEIFDEVRGEHNYQQPNLNVAIEFPDDDVKLEDYNKTGLDVYIDGIQVEVNKFYSFNTTGYHTVKYHFKGEGLRKGDIKYLFRRRIYITKIKFIKMAVKGIEDLQSMFYDCNNLRSIEGLEKIDTSNVDNMDYMFQCCYSLTSLNLNSFNTWKVTTMGSMFEFCNSLQSIKIDNFDTFFVKNFNSWFYDCTSLTSLDISKLDFYHSSDFADSFTNDHNLHLKLTQKQYDNIIYKGFNELEKQVAEVKIVKKN